jgi:Xaa-Pro aminopeptidase
MRLFKEPAEIAAMERSAAIAARAHRDAMALARPGLFEYELEAAIEKRFKKEGASGPSYASIVASGENATILHYTENRRRMSAGDLVLVDAGCEVDGYASDITRTFPVSGAFSRPQKRIYDAVLAAQRAAIARIRPGAPYDAGHKAAREVLLDACLDLGLLRGKRATLLAKNAAQRFCLHNVSHWLGLDVHDRGRYRDEKGRPRKLESGMVLTVEPGLYVRPDEKRVPKEYLGLGVRIEDDALVTKDGARILTAGAPKEPREMLAAMGGRR